MSDCADNCSVMCFCWRFWTLFWFCAPVSADLGREQARLDCTSVFCCSGEGEGEREGTSSAVCGERASVAGDSDGGCEEAWRSGTQSVNTAGRWVVLHWMLLQWAAVLLWMLLHASSSDDSFDIGSIGLSGAYCNNSRLLCGSVVEWLRSRTCDQRVAGLNPGCRTAECNPGQVVYTHVPLSPSNIIWPIGGGARCLRRYCRRGGK